MRWRGPRPSRKVRVSAMVTREGSYEGRREDLTDFPSLLRGNVEAEVLEHLSSSSPWCPATSTLLPPHLYQASHVWGTLLLELTDQTKQGRAADNQSPFWPHIGLLACQAWKRRRPVSPTHSRVMSPSLLGLLARSPSSHSGLPWLGQKVNERPDTMSAPLCKGTSLSFAVWPWASPSPLWAHISAARQEDSSFLRHLPLLQPPNSFGQSSYMYQKREVDPPHLWMSVWNFMAASDHNVRAGC